VIFLLSVYQWEAFESHKKYEFHGSFYQFHSPYEMPSEDNPQFMSHIDDALQFFVEAEITELGDTLTDYPVERFDEWFGRVFDELW
jgi:hypothetical protein